MDIRVTKTIVEVYFMEAELQATAVCIQSSANRWWSWSICRRSTRGIWRTMQMISKLSSVRWTYDRKNGTVFFSNLERLRSRDTRPVQAWKSSVTLYGRNRLKNACGRVLAFTTVPSVRNISSLLKNEKALPDIPQPEQPENINRYTLRRAVSRNESADDWQAYRDEMTAMAAEFANQIQDSSFYSLGFEERLSMLVTAEWNCRQNNNVTRLIRNAEFSIPSAVM